MQKLSVKFKNTPGNASQVPCSVNEVLNREDTLGVSRKVLADNISDENLHSGKSGQNMRVFVLNMMDYYAGSKVSLIMENGFGW